jgi:uncharacterized membrane protein YhaH (DUF805 family)
MPTPNLWSLIPNGLLFGLLLGVLMSLIVLVIAKVNPEIMLKDHPPDVQAKYGPISDRARRLRLPLGIVILSILVALVAISLDPLLDTVERTGRFVAVFINLVAMFTFFNILDWLVLDWLIVVTIRPKFIVLPGTEGMPGYSDYGFHFRGLLIGIPITVLTSLLLAARVAILP